MHVVVPIDDRLLIANTLTARGWTVWHLIGDAPPRRHELGRWGADPSVDGTGQVIYPAEQAEVNAGVTSAVTPNASCCTAGPSTTGKAALCGRAHVP